MKVVGVVKVVSVVNSVEGIVGENECEYSHSGAHWWLVVDMTTHCSDNHVILYILR